MGGRNMRTNLNTIWKLRNENKKKTMAKNPYNKEIQRKIQ